MDDPKKLTPKEEKFCFEYCIDLNATQEAIRAGYSQKTARTIGSRLLTKVDISLRITKMKTNLAETAGITALRILREHAKIAFSSIGSIHDTWYDKKDFENLPEDIKGCISEIETKTRIEYMASASKKKIPTKVEMIRVKLYDKQKALDAITAMLGFNAAIRNELIGKLDFGQFSDDQLDQIIMAIFNKRSNG